MSKDLESVVRPFQIGDVFTRARLPPVTEIPTIVVPEDVIVDWQGSPDTEYVDQGGAWYTSWNSDLKEDKTQRVSKLVKVVNPDDTDQKVFVERIDKAVFKNDQGKELALNFDWSSPKDGGA